MTTVQKLWRPTPGGDVLLERDHELQSLDRVVQASRAGEPVMAFIEGYPDARQQLRDAAAYGLRFILSILHRIGLPPRSAPANRDGYRGTSEVSAALLSPAEQGPPWASGATRHRRT